MSSRALDAGWLPIAWLVATPTAFSLLDLVLPVPVVTPVRACFLLLTLVLVFDWWRRPRGSSDDPIGRWMVLFLGAMGIALVANAVRTSGSTLRADATLFAEGYVMAFVAFKAGRRIRLTRGRVLAAVGGLAGVGIYLAAAGIGQYAFGWNMVPARVEIVHPMRVVGPFGNGVFYALTTSLLMLMALSIYRATARWPARAGVLLATAAMLLVIVLAKGRAPVLALVLAMAYLAWRRPWTIVPSVVVVALAGALSVAMVQRPQQPFAPASRLTEQAVLEDASVVARTTATGPIQSRIAVLAVAANMAWHHPVFGLGFGVSTFGAHKDEYFPDAFGIPRQWLDWPTVPHNEWLFVLVSAGLVGFIPFVGLQVTIWRRMAMIARRGTVDRDEATLVADLPWFVQAAQITLLVNALFVDVVFFGYALMLFYFLVGLADAQWAEASLAPGSREG